MYTGLLTDSSWCLFKARENVLQITMPAYMAVIFFMLMISIFGTNKITTNYGFQSFKCGESRLKKEVTSTTSVHCSAFMRLRRLNFLPPTYALLYSVELPT